MKEKNHDPFLFHCISHRMFILVLSVMLFSSGMKVSVAQDKTLDGHTYTRYKRGYFKPDRQLNYSLFAAPILTVDPLGIGGRSTYALSAGSRVTLWESKAADQALQGLRIKGLYTAIGYEYFPQQYDNAYVSLWSRIKTFMMIVARMDALYSFGYDRRGIATRFCVGFEIRKFTFLMTGTVYSRNSDAIFGEHPVVKTPYNNSGSIMLLIPLYTHPRK